MRNPPGPHTPYPGAMAEVETARALFKDLADRVDERLYGVREPSGSSWLGSSPATTS